VQPYKHQAPAGLAQPAPSPSARCHRQVGPACLTFHRAAFRAWLELESWPRPRRSVPWPAGQEGRPRAKIKVAATAPWVFHPQNPSLLRAPRAASTIASSLHPISLLVAYPSTRRTPGASQGGEEDDSAACSRPHALHPRRKLAGVVAAMGLRLAESRVVLVASPLSFPS
jgi:hypothetical protein